MPIKFITRKSLASAESLAGIGKNLPEILYIPRTEEAIGKAVELGTQAGLPVLGTGSFYLAAEIRDKIRD
jgi:dihydrofolate synthase/folylpolyglutamate synthase